MIDVLIIKKEKDATLVQWIDGDMPRRTVIPSDAIIDRQVEKNVLLQGIEHGVPWEDILQVKISARDVCRELRKRDIWTFEDVRKNSKSVVAALQAAYKIDLSSMLKLEANYE